MSLTLPKDNLLRGAVGGAALRAANDGGEAGADSPVMAGHFAVFGQWTEIRSWEGNFLEQFSPGAFKKTIRENRDGMKVLFQHGYDYMIGDKPLGPIRELREDGEGTYYEVPLLDAAYVRDDILPGLEAGLYGASFRFRVIREEVVEEPGISDHNPKGLPERTVKEAHVIEFGPVTFPAYEGASAGLRSLEVDELVAQAALARMRSRDADQARELAVRFAERDAAPTDEEPAADEPTAAEDETSPANEADDNTSPETPEVDGEDTNDAPPQDGAEPDEAHPDRGRRAKPTPLYGVTDQTPTWRL